VQAGCCKQVLPGFQHGCHQHISDLSCSPWHDSRQGLTHEHVTAFLQCERKHSKGLDRQMAHWTKDQLRNEKLQHDILAQCWSLLAPLCGLCVGDALGRSGWLGVSVAFCVCATCDVRFLCFSWALFVALALPSALASLASSFLVRLARSGACPALRFARLSMHRYVSSLCHYYM
jgi:hypothetical protein